VLNVVEDKQLSLLSTWVVFFMVIIAKLVISKISMNLDLLKFNVLFV